MEFVAPSAIFLLLLVSKVMKANDQMFFCEYL